MTGDERRIGPTYRVLSQDLYATDMHADEIGIRQAEVWRSKSRQFSKDAEIIGKIMEAQRKTEDEDMPSLEKTGFIIIRDSLWSGAEDELSRRMVLKLFSDSGGWIATIEEMVAEELAYTFGSGLPIVSFAVMTRDSEVVTYIRQVNRGTLAMENFAFYLLGPDGAFDVFRIERKRVSAGGDYNVFRLRDGQKVSEVDSKFGDIGGEFQVIVKDPVLAENEWYCHIMQAFAAMLRYRDPIKEKIQRVMDKWARGDFDPRLQRLEVSLLANPRKLSLSMEEFEEI